MPKFNCSYAYDVPYYFDLCVEAKSERDAKKQLRKALLEGVFAGQEGSACYDNECNHRAFVSSKAEDEGFTPDDTLAELIAAHRKP